MLSKRPCLLFLLCYGKAWDEAFQHNSASYMSRKCVCLASLVSSIVDGRRSGNVPYVTIQATCLDTYDKLYSVFQSSRARLVNRSLFAGISGVSTASTGPRCRSQQSTQLCWQAEHKLPVQSWLSPQTSGRWFVFISATAHDMFLSLTPRRALQLLAGHRLDALPLPCPTRRRIS